MLTIYVFDNELLGDDGQQFSSALIDQYNGTEDECTAWFNDKYNSNDYTASFTAP